MPKSNFIPVSDNDFLVWFYHSIDNLTKDFSVSESDLTALKAANINVHASNTEALAKQATADKNDSRQSAKAMFRTEVRRIKARPDYTK